MNCVQQVPNPLPQSALPTLCRCAPGFSGASDMYDNRVALDGDGSWLALECPNSDVGTLIIWSVFLVALAIRQAITLVSLSRSFGSENRRGKSFLTYMPTRVGCLDFFVATPLLIVSAALKLTGAQVIGTDVPVTATLSVGFALWTAIWADYSYSQFGMLLRARMQNHRETERVAVVYRTVSVLQVAVFCLATVLPTMLMLVTDKRLGPAASNERTLLIIRNIGLLAWIVALVAGIHITTKQLKSLVLPTMSSSDSAKTAAAMVMAFLTAKQLEVAKIAAVTTLVYVLFLIPFLYGFVQYAVCFLGILSAFSSSPALVFIRSKAVADKGQHLQLSGLKPSKGSSVEPDKNTATSQGGQSSVMVAGPE
jgi:hypothetical protein